MSETIGGDAAVQCPEVQYPQVLKRVLNVIAKWAEKPVEDIHPQVRVVNYHSDGFSALGEAVQSEFGLEERPQIYCNSTAADIAVETLAELVSAILVNEVRKVIASKFGLEFGSVDPVQTILAIAADVADAIQDEFDGEAEEDASDDVDDEELDDIDGEDGDDR